MHHPVVPLANPLVDPARILNRDLSMFIFITRTPRHRFCDKTLEASASDFIFRSVYLNRLTGIQIRRLEALPFRPLVEPRVSSSMTVPAWFEVK